MDLDKVLLDIGGIGNYQRKRYCLLCLVLIFATFPTLSYVFTARDVDYRCSVDGCDIPNTLSQYNASWVQYAVPYKNGRPSKCLQYKRLSDRCNGWSFQNNVTEKCNRFVYRNEDSTIAKDFNIVCEENLWKLTIVGSINNIGFLLGLPLSGFISDRYGRKTLMLLAIMFSTIMGIIKSFSINYLFFITFEFLDMMLGSGLYTAAYILGMELLTPEYRVLGSTIMSSAFALGEALIGLTAWFVPWRTFLRILYIPGIFFVSCYWRTDESFRWMISKDRHEDAARALQKIAAENGRRMDEREIKRLQHEGVKTTGLQQHHVDTFLEALCTPTLLIRLANCSLAWISCTFVYYGLTMHSVGISGNVYINFIAVSLIEIPAYILANRLLNQLGRRTTLAASFMTSGLACIGFIYTPESESTIRLVLFLLGKFSATISYATIYLYTTEMFPTSLRHTFMSTCSMFGRIGSIIAPQVPILAEISDSLPLFLFATMAGISGLLSLFFPETLNVKLPDTIIDAVQLGRQSKEEYSKS